MNDLKVLAYNIQNAYLTAPCHKKIWMTTGAEFRSDTGKIILVVRVLYGLKSSRAAFRAFLAETLYNIGYEPSAADPDLWIRPSLKDDGFKYWEYVLCYINNVLSISHKPEHTMKGIEAKFKLKDNKMEEPNVYLGTELSRMDNEQGDL